MSAAGSSPRVGTKGGLSVAAKSPVAVAAAIATAAAAVVPSYPTPATTTYTSNNINSSGSNVAAASSSSSSTFSGSVSLVSNLVAGAQVTATSSLGERIQVLILISTPAQLVHSIPFHSHFACQLIV
jgi:hypothetical protein